MIREPFTIVENPHTIVESVGNIDNTKLYVSDKEIDAAIYLTDKAIETRYMNISLNNQPIKAIVPKSMYKFRLVILTDDIF